jgi:pimeloyl-ACP methyl ester carboxylesterase
LKPVFFGPAERQLYGVFHEAAGAPRGTAVLICQPFAFEYMRMRWVHRFLAEVLAERGFASLRFDWTGVGDSSGDLSGGSIARWCEDVALGAEQLLDSQGAARLCLFGCGFSGTLAALAGARLPRVASLALLDPEVRGAGYLSRLRAFEAKEHANAAFAPAAGAEELLGLRLPAALEQELASIDLATAPAGHAAVLLLDSTASLATGQLEGWLRAAGVVVRRTVVPEALDDYSDELQETLLSAAMPAAVARALEAELE